MAFFACLERGMCFRPPFLFCATRNFRTARTAFSTSLCFIDCKHLCRFLILQTMAFSSTDVSILQYAFSSPVLMTLSSRLLIVLSFLTPGKSPDFTALHPLLPFSRHHSTASLRDSCLLFIFL